jgi:hypothetical protein
MIRDQTIGSFKIPTRKFKNKILYLPVLLIPLGKKAYLLPLDWNFLCYHMRLRNRSKFPLYPILLETKFLLGGAFSRLRHRHNIYLYIPLDPSLLFRNICSMLTIGYDQGVSTS